MPKLSLREAAELAGTSKSTIFRAIKSGRLSAERTDDGGFAIDAAELLRVYTAKPVTIASNHCGTDPVGQDATVHHSQEVELRLALADAEARSLREMLAEVRAARDHWREQATRVTGVLAICGPERKLAWWRKLAG